MSNRPNVSCLSDAELISGSHAALARLHGHVFAADAAITALRLELEDQPGMEAIRLDDVEQHLAELAGHGEADARAGIAELGSRLLVAQATLNAQEIAA